MYIKGKNPNVYSYYIHIFVYLFNTSKDSIYCIVKNRNLIQLNNKKYISNDFIVFTETHLNILSFSIIFINMDVNIYTNIIYYA